MTRALYLVAGLGKTGLSIAGFLQRRNLPFVVFDTRQDVEGLAQFKQSFPGVEVFLREFPSSLYPELTAVITSPGVPLEEPFLQEALRLNIPVYGDIECLAREIKAPVLAITGTNGKSTVTTLVGEMAKAAGLAVAVAGNIGAPVLDLLDDEKDYALWVLELSSFQLDLTHSLKPLAATILNISADHLDRHGSFEAYAAAKQRIYHEAQFLFYNRDDSTTKPREKTGKMTSFGLDKPLREEWGIIEHQGQSYLAFGDELLLSLARLKLKGKHNWQNALAAAALADAAGIKRDLIIQVLESFVGLPHRCQWVRNLSDVDWINDSKGTNIGAAISAIGGIGSAMQGKIVLIAGGLGKGADFNELRPAVKQHVRSLVLMGTDADKIAEALGDLIPYVRANTLEDAVKEAKFQALPGDVVLLSPACSSLDMFRDFNHRGELFTKLVNQL